MRDCVILDRDGTIIEQKHYLSEPGDVVLIPDAGKALRKLANLGFLLVVATNQSPIGRGIFSEERLSKINERMVALLEEEKATLTKIYHCPHIPEEHCSCRKPNRGMIDKAIEELSVVPKYVIGDKRCDIELGQRIGATTLLVLTGYGAEEEKKLVPPPDYVVYDLAEAAKIIERLSGTS